MRSGVLSHHTLKVEVLKTDSSYFGPMGASKNLDTLMTSFMGTTARHPFLRLRYGASPHDPSRFEHCRHDSVGQAGSMKGRAFNLHPVCQLG